MSDLHDERWRARRQRFRSRYSEGEVPWDDPLPPPELIDLAARMDAGRALDLGTGYGRAAIYLARLGWQVDAIDYVPDAIREACRRAARAGVCDRARFHLGEVTDLGALRGPYDLAVDVGCLHGMNEAEMRMVRDHLERLLRPGGIFLLFAHLGQDEDGPEADATTNGEHAGTASGGSTADEDDRPRKKLDEGLLHALWRDGFELVRLERGTTTAGDETEVPSAWFWWRRAE